MGIFIGKKTRAIVQGITGTQGRFHTKLMLDYGTKIVAGVTPGKGLPGTDVLGVPVYDTVKQAVNEHKPNASIIFVPAPFAAEATLEAMEADIRTIVIITEHIPIKDAIQIMAHAKEQEVIVIGPNTPGIITPEECKLGIMPAHIFKQGAVGIASRSGTLTYEIASELTKRGYGQSTCFGLGGDPIVGLSFVDALEGFEKDNLTNAVVLIGEIGGRAEEDAAEYITAKKYSKPVVAFVAGRTAPPGKRMGHAGAIITGKSGTAKSKIEAFKKNGVKVADKPSDISRFLEEEISPTDEPQ
ncbi:MAG: succinate--CoA ligase subunit alpha [Candidatus Bathyarchaeota archaeon]|nr:succinate--CoA ligase subunit alpha [Candidatus Bathyarchaeota archaeon]